VVLDLIAGHDRLRFDPAVVLFCVDPPAGEVLATLEQLGVPVRQVRKQRRYDAAAIARLGRAFRALSTEIVALHGFGGYSFGAPAGPRRTPTCRAPR
jgi:hypothetical protein